METPRVPLADTAILRHLQIRRSHRAYHRLDLPTSGRWLPLPVDPSIEGPCGSTVPGHLPADSVLDVGGCRDMTAMSHLSGHGAKPYRVVVFISGDIDPP